MKKSVVWFDDGKRPNVADQLEKEADISLHRLAYDGPQADVWRALSASHVYCITSTRQEQPEEFRANAALLARCPDLLAVSTSGAGYDTVDAKACTAAGVLVVNQSGGNADAVAEHALAMLLSLTKNIPQTDRSLRSGKRAIPRDFKGWNATAAPSASSASAIPGGASRASAAGARDEGARLRPLPRRDEIRARGATKVDLRRCSRSRASSRSTARTARRRGT